jgi:hypothetical protein
MEENQKYYQGKTITTTKNVAKSLDGEINDLLTLFQIFRDLAI